MLMMIEGDLGTGKTLLLSYYGQKEIKVPVYTNYNLDVPKFKRKITPYDIEGLYEGLVLLQGFYAWLDCRLSSSELNRYLSRDLVFNSRKKRLMIMVDLQLEDSIDKRFKKLCKIVVEAKGLLPDESGFLYLYNIKNRKKPVAKVLPIEKAEKLFNIYDTEEPERTPTPSIFEKNRLNKYVNAVVKVIMNETGGKNITKNGICEILLEHKKNIPPKKIIDLIYARLKRMNED